LARVEERKIAMTKGHVAIAFVLGAAVGYVAAKKLAK
jgi:hypothetical protein